MKDDGFQGWEQRALAAQLSDALGVPERSLTQWLDAGLIACHPEADELEIELTDAAAVRSLSTSKLRTALDRLHAWLPTPPEPRKQLTLVYRDGPLLVRLPGGTLADATGQFRFDYALDTDHLPLGYIGPREATTAAEWHERGVEQECDGNLAAAVVSYQRALAVGGPDAQIIFDLASALAELGHTDRALERYRQLVELDPLHADAWNNLGDLLMTDEQPAAAISAFRHALDIAPDDAAAHYNFADALDEAGDSHLARLHFETFVRLSEERSPQRTYARAMSLP